MKIFTTNNLHRLFLLLTVMVAGVNSVCGANYTFIAKTAVKEGKGSARAEAWSVDVVILGDKKVDEATSTNSTVVEATNTVYTSTHTQARFFATPEIGYEFKGWYSSNESFIANTAEYSSAKQNGGTKNSTYVVEAYAKFKPKNYKVSLNANGGSVGYDSKVVTYDADYDELPTPTRDGYEFDGWYLAVNGDSKVITSTIVKTAYDHTLYAHWKPIFYFSATAFKNEGDGNAVSASVSASSITKAVGKSTASTTATFTATPDEANGYSFDGWYPDSSYIERIETSTSYETDIINTTPGSTKNLTLYAKFVQQLTPEFTGGDQSLLVDGTYTGFAFRNTSSAKPSSSSSDNFYYSFTENTPSCITAGSAHPTKIIGYDSETNTLTAYNAGVAKITFTQKAVGLYVAASVTYTITVTKHDNPIAITMDGASGNSFTVSRSSEHTMNWTSPSGAVYTILPNASNKAVVATLNEGTKKINAGYSNGSCTWTVNQAENYKYEARTASFTITVANAVEEICYLVNTEGEKEITPNEFAERSWSDVLDVAGELSFFGREQWGAAGSSITPMQKVNGNWEDLSSISGSLESSYPSVPFTRALNPSAKSIKFKGSGTLSRYIKNVKVTRKTFLTTSVDELPLPQKTISGAATTATFDIKWSSSNGGDIHIVSDNPLFTVSPEVIENTSCRSGITTVTITYNSSEAGTHTGTLHVYDAIRSTTVSLSGTTQNKLATHIVWTGKPDSEEYSEADGTLANPFKVYDANNNEIVGAVVTYTSSNSYIAQVNNDGTFSPYCGGDVTLTATYAGNESYQGCTDTKTIHIALCEPVVAWNQEFRFSTEDITSNNQVTLTADVRFKDNSSFAPEHLHYSTDNTSVATAAGTNLTLVGAGETQLQLAIDAQTNMYGQQYEATTIYRTVKIRNAGEACGTLVLDEPKKLALNVYNTSGDKNTVYTIDSEVPTDKITFKAWKYNGVTTDDMTMILTYWDGSTDSHVYKVSELSTSSTDKTIPLAKNLKQIKFAAGGTLYKYFSNIEVHQKKIFEVASQDGFTSNIDVRTEEKRYIRINYSDVPAIQCHIENLASTADPSLTTCSVDVRCTTDDLNDCGDFGTKDFIVTVRSDKATVLTGNVVITSASESPIKIPFTFTVKVGATFTFDQVDNGEWKTSTNWSLGTEHQHGQVPTSANPVVIEKSVRVTGQVAAASVQLYSSANIVIEPRAGLTIYEGGITNAEKQAIVNSNQIVIKSDEHGSGYLRIIKDGSTAQMPYATVQMYSKAYDAPTDNSFVDDAKWQYIGSPVAYDAEASTHNTAIADWVDSNTSINVWSNSRQTWGIPSRSYGATPFLMYCVASQNDIANVFNFKGQLINSDYDATMTVREPGSETYLCTANSYTAPIDVRGFVDSDFSSNVEHTIYLYNTGSHSDWENPSAENPAGQYTAVPLGSAANLADISSTPIVIPSMQGMVFKCVTTESNKTASVHFDYNRLVFKGDQTLYNTNILRAPARTRSQETDSLSGRLAVQLVSGPRVDALYMLESDMYTANFDNGYDAHKLDGTTTLSFYTNEHGERMSVDATDNIAGTYLGFNAGEDSLHTLTFNYVETAEPLYLKDMLTDSIIVVEQGASYRFYCSNATTDALRFRLLNEDMLPADYWTGNGGETNPGMTTDISATESSALMWLDGDVVYSVAEGASTIALYDLNGRLIMTRSFCNMGSLSLANLPAGIYMAQSGSRLLKIVR